MQLVRRVFLFICLVTSPVWSVEARSADLKKTENALGLINKFADRFCDRIPLNGTEENLELSGEAKAQLQGLLKKLTHLGIEGAANYQLSDYEGILATDLKDALRDNQNCRLRIWEDLKKLVSTSQVRHTPPPPPPGELTRAEFPSINVGDTWTYRGYFNRKNQEIEWSEKVLFVSSNGDFKVQVHNEPYGNYVMGYTKAVVRTFEPIRGVGDPAREYLRFPLTVGAEWDQIYTNESMSGKLRTYDNHHKVAAVESVKTRAGVFQAFRIEKTQQIVGTNREYWEKYWYAPSVKRIVKHTSTFKNGYELIYVTVE